MSLSFKRNFLLFSFITLFLFSNAQHSTPLSGTVVDAQNNEALPFVNVGIVGSLKGTASNPQGNFSFDIANDMVSSQLYFSAIGYLKKQMPVADFLRINGDTIKLEPHSYGIDDIEVSTKSKVIYRIIKDILENVDENYITGPYNMTALYSEELYEENVSSKKRDALVKMSDKTAYEKRDEGTQTISYRFENVWRNFDVNDLYSGITDMNNLLSFDIVRNKGNVLDTTFLDAYELKSANFEDDQTLVSYVLKEPDFHKTGDFHVTACKGSLYINNKDHALLKAEIQISSSLHSIHGKDIATDAKHAFLRNVQYRYIATWSKGESGYRLDQVSCLKEGSGQEGKTKKILSSLKILEVNTETSEEVSGRDYYENMLSDPDFWLSFN